MFLNQIRKTMETHLLKVHLLNSIENIVAKGEIAHCEQFLLLQQFFNNRLLQVSETVCMWKWVNPFPHMTILQQTNLNVFYQKIENLHN